jgi:dihydrodipicolinate synthase/N-acetylneuraminate lyase
MNHEVLFAHFTAVAEQSPVPVLLYNIPRYAHLVLDPALVAELAEHPNVVGIKDSSGDMELLAGYVRVQKEQPRFTVLTGHGPTFSTALKVGARGGILAVALFTGDTAPLIFDAWRGGNTARADELQSLITEAAKEVVGTHGVPGVKAAMDAAGLHGGNVRAPLRPLDEARRRIVESLVQRSTETARPTPA